MKLNSVNSFGTKGVAFGRAFTTTEESKWQKIQAEAKKKLGLNDTFMICFDSCMPETKGEDKGVGSSFSAAAKDFTDFATSKFGLTGIQYAPQGRLSGMTASPFSGTAFTLGEHLIDLKQLTTSAYGEILSERDYKKTLLAANSATVNYEKLPPHSGPVAQAIGSAFLNFKKLPENSPLKVEYGQFIEENQDWLEKEALYDCLEEDYKTYWENWPAEYRDLFSGKYSPSKIKEKTAQIKAAHQETFDKILFTQFILDKQQQATKAAYNAQGQKLVGDCLIGFSGKEEWGNREAFVQGRFLGCKSSKPDDPEDVERCCWGIPALDMNKLGKPENLDVAGKLLARKMELSFKRYDALRVDAAWQLIKPYYYETDTTTGKRLPLKTQPERLGSVALDIIESTLKKARPNDYKTYPLNLELLGGPIKYNDPITSGRMQIHHSIYQHAKLDDSWGFVKFYKQGGLSENEFIFGLGTHDDSTLIQIEKEKSGEQAPVLAANLGLNKRELSNNPSGFYAAKFGEIFTTKNNFFTVFDAMGIDKRINTQNDKDTGNWGARVSPNYEAEYHKNLINGRGLNLPQAYLIALKAKGIRAPELEAKLTKASKVLTSDEGGDIYTQKIADEKLGAKYSKIG